MIGWIKVRLVLTWDAELTYWFDLAVDDHQFILILLNR